MKKKLEHTVRDYIKKETGITISSFLELYIYEPSRLRTANTDTLKRLVREYESICKQFKHLLNGPLELQRIASFEMCLSSRFNNKPELQKYLD